ncbi:ParB/RepB/Spo0J family partition protein [Altererythrobacter arenosus]|uniref:ParB/RepB/Spo0J family partition protein n=1 Tax=Altererythrobacter arenosus TaxID=3032592 RepID=A0ABY8FX79_9SPHN|nr:ParB/RepB/Spo0J family partition protein [Altererythrobacter sp. CAU 1644]WFL78665.1 ParB/RepB/Spo0J family partition protein [Altererythrobacter sp. CAU 1644]
MNDTSDPIRFSVPQRSASDTNKKRLGKGLGALLGETRREEPLVRREITGAAENSDDSIDYSRSTLTSLSISAIEPLPGQPRKRFDDESLGELAASIAARGVIQPIIVRPRGEGRFQLVAGERRWRAAQKARLHEIPALVRDLDDREVMALALIENIQREDLNPVEEARAYHRLSEDEGMTQAEIAQMVEKSRSHVANLQRLLNLPEGVLDMVEDGRLSMGHARALIGNEAALALAKRAVNDNLSVREVEKLARGEAEGAKPAKNVARSSREPAKDADIAAVQAHLEEFLGLTVRIKTDADPRSGAVTIRYRTLDQLDLICQRLTGGDI